MSCSAFPRFAFVNVLILRFSPKNAKVSANTDNGNPSTSQPAAFSIFPAAELARSELWDEVEKEGGPHRPKFSKKDLDDRKAKV